MNTKLKLTFEELLAVTVSLEMHRDSKPHLWSSNCEEGLNKLKTMRGRSFRGSETEKADRPLIGKEAS